MCRVRRIRAGYYIYMQYQIRNHGYYPPDKCRWWEAVNEETGEADFHAHRLRDIVQQIDESGSVG